MSRQIFHIFDAMMSHISQAQVCALEIMMFDYILDHSPQCC